MKHLVLGDLRKLCTPAKVRQFKNRKGITTFPIGSGQNWNRTSDTRIFSPLLYRLSYLARLEKSKIVNMTIFLQSFLFIFFQRVQDPVGEYLRSRSDAFVPEAE